MPNKKTPSPKPQNRSKAPRGAAPKPDEGGPAITLDLAHAKQLEPRHFELREDWTIRKTDDQTNSAEHKKAEKNHNADANAIPSPLPLVAPVQTGGRGEGQGEVWAIPDLIFSHDTPVLRLYHAECFQLLDAIAAKYPQGLFDAS